MRFFSLKIFVLAGFLALSVHAEKLTQPNVAVLPFSGDKTFSADQLDFITAKFSGELVAVGTFKVLDRGKMNFILQEQGFQQSGICTSSQCKVEMGQMLGVDNLIAGKLVRFGSTYALHLEYIDVGTGEIIRTIDTEQKGDLEDVYKELCYSAALLLNRESDTRTVVSKKESQKPEISDGAIPGKKSRSLSTKRKVALALWGSSIAGGGLGFYFNQQGDEYTDDYKAAIEAQDRDKTQSAYDDTQAADRYRNVSYGISLGTLAVGAVLWFWPEGK